MITMRILCIWFIFILPVTLSAQQVPLALSLEKALEMASDNYIPVRTVPAILSYSSPVAGKDQQQLIGFRIENREELFIPGMKGWLSSAKPEPSLLVPPEAAISNDNVRYIFIFSDNCYKRVRILQGQEYNGMIEILNNEIISHNDPVVYKGAELLQKELLKRSVSLQ